MRGKHRRIGIICMECGHRGRHVMGGAVRLRDRACEECGGRGRPIWWAQKYPQKALGEASPAVAAQLQALGVRG